MEKTGWPYFATILSISIGWFLNELGQWFRSRKEDKKAVKKVLYHLLDAYYIFNQLDTSQISKLIISRLTLRVPEHQRGLFEVEMNKYFSSLIKELVQADVAENLEKIEKEYSISINNLSFIDPIRAFRLSGKTRILQTFDLLQNSLKKIAVSNGSVSEKEQIQNQIDTAMEVLKPKIISEAISDLEDEISSLSFFINPITWLKTKKTIKRIKSRLKTEGAIKIDEWINKLEIK